MARIVIAGCSEPSRARLARLLSSSGHPVFRVCASAGELRRVLHDGEDGLLIMAGLMADCSADELFWDYGERVQILLIARPPELERCEEAGIFRLALPTSQQAVLGAVEMLSQLHGMRMPKRAAEEKQAVEAAKRLLMRRDGLTEPQAHRALQQFAMRHGLRMADCAARIVNENGGIDHAGSSISPVS